MEKQKNKTVEKCHESQKAMSAAIAQVVGVIMNNIGCCKVCRRKGAMKFKTVEDGSGAKMCSNCLWLDPATITRPKSNEETAV